MPSVKKSIKKIGTSLDISTTGYIYLQIVTSLILNLLRLCCCCCLFCFWFLVLWFFGFLVLVFLFFFLNIFIRYFPHLYFQCYPKSPPYPPPPTPLPAHSYFLALAFPCTGAYKVCKSNGPLFPVMAD